MARPFVLRAPLLAAATLVALVGCESPTAVPQGSAAVTPGVTPTPEPRPVPSPTPTAEPTATPGTATTAEPAAFDVTRAQQVIADLAGTIGPREATGPGYAAAADYVEARLAALGYEVRRQPVDVPAGESWGVAVPAGRTWNVVASAPGVDLAQPHLVVGAHLDTVPQAPGAVDNASGVAVLLETARLAAADPPQVPLVLVAFGAEEPRGPGDDLHHFGSQAFVAALGPAQRQAMLGAVAIDSVGVSAQVPICSAGGAGEAFAGSVRQAVQAAGIEVRVCENRTSDHWSFVRNGLPGVRVGLAGTAEYPQYHSAADMPAVVVPEALASAGAAVWAAVGGP